ncbi:MAG: hypothetical protein PUD59_03745 [bacterium]|nr:hypothetical protein [bacterium]
MNKIEKFSNELDYIKNKKLREDCCVLIEELPDYFFSVPASSTGKYHPKYALGEGGLLRHTKAAVRIAFELLSNPLIGDKYNDEEKDLMLIGLMIHDGLKSGKVQSKYTKFDHPLLMCNYIRENESKLSMSKDNIDFLCSVISSHMGIWNKDFDGNEVLPIPKNKYQNFVHMCDYLASRKSIILEFDNDNNIIG